jgi:hypothetical protein
VSISTFSIRLIDAGSSQSPCYLFVIVTVLEAMSIDSVGIGDDLVDAAWVATAIWIMNMNVFRVISQLIQLY